MEEQLAETESSVIPRTAQGWIFANRSSTVTVVNDLPTESLAIKGYAAELGTVLNAPASIIQPGGTTTMRIRDKTGPLGSKGWMNYVIGGDGAEILITFECPTLASNQVTAVPSDHTTVGSYDPSGPLVAEVRIH